MRTVTSADGTEIAYDVHGDGPPLVLLHGDATREYWDPIVPRLRDDYTLYVPDRRGRGDSGDREEYSLQREVEDALAVIEQTDGEPALFGHSFGGLQAIETARHGEVSKLVAYEPAIIVGEYAETADLADEMERHIENGEPAKAMRAHVKEVIHGGEIGEAALDRWLDEWPLWPEYVDFAENSLRMNRAIEGYEMPEEYGIDVPALMLTGTEGPSHLRDSVRAANEALPNSRLVEFDAVTHAGPVEALDRILEEVRAFIGDETVADQEA